jgi:hypothetical protein
MPAALRGVSMLVPLVQVPLATFSTMGGRGFLPNAKAPSTKSCPAVARSQDNSDRSCLAFFSLRAHSPFRKAVRPRYSAE